MGAGRERLIRELKMVQVAGCRRVAMLGEVYQQFTDLDGRWKKKFEKHFENYGVPRASMPKEHFNSEGRFPTGGKDSRDVQLFAFKAFQHRLYGVTVAIETIETFVGLKLIEDKKRNRADQELLKRVAQSFKQYDD